jgi:hypothetical protein
LRNGAKGFALKDVNPEFLKDKDVVRTACKSFPLALSFADAELKRDKEFAMECVANYSGANLQFLDQSLRNDYDICLKAVINSPKSIRYIDPSLLQSHKDIALYGLIDNEDFFLHLPSIWKKNKLFIMEALSINVKVFLCLDDDEQQDFQILTYALGKVPAMYGNLSKRLKNDDYVAGAALEASSGTFRYMIDSRQSDPATAMCAIQQDPTLYTFAKGAAAKDEEIIFIAVDQNPNMWFQCVPKEIRHQYNNELDDFLMHINQQYVKG